MPIKKHGLSIGIERVDDDFYLTITAVGKLTHQDYEVMTPMIDSALEGVDRPSIKAFVDARELEGWEARAAWDDFKIGVKHGRYFDRTALLGNKKWQEVGAKIGGWFTGGEVKFFDDEDAALTWLKG